MKIEIEPAEFGWLLRGFVRNFNHAGAGYNHTAFDLAQGLIAAATELTAEEKRELSDDLWVIAFPKGNKAREIEAARSARPNNRRVGRV